MVEVKLHDIGEGMTEGEIVHLFVKEGDQVKVDEPLVEVQTDKMTAELPSPSAGTVKQIFIQKGDVIEVGRTMLIIDSANTKTETDNIGTRELTAHLSTHRFKEECQLVDVQGPKRILAAPHTRKMARQLGVKLEGLIGSGRLGRITDDDVLNAQAKWTDREANAHLSPIIKRGETDEIDKVTPTAIPFIGRRKVIAKKMCQSLYTIPHVTHFDEADVSDLMQLRETLKGLDRTGEKGYHASIAAYFIKAIAISLREFPIFNARLDEVKEVIQMSNAVHMGLATDTDEGLIVPVIRHVEAKSLQEIHQEMKHLIDKAKRSKLRAQEISGSTFTISNVGPLGSTGATPIINYPEVGLMAFHKTKKRPIVNEEDQIVVRSMMNISMSFDHRVADGAKAVAFTNHVIELIQNPEIMLLSMR